MTEFRVWYREDNAAIRERYDLIMERIAAIEEETGEDRKERGRRNTDDFFHRTALRIRKVAELIDRKESGEFEQAGEEKLAEWNRALFWDLLPENYSGSYADPDYAALKLGVRLGRLFSAVDTELYAMIAYAHEGLYDRVTYLAELFVELYVIASDGESIYPSCKQAFYWFMSDYSDVYVRDRICELLDPDASYAASLLEGWDGRDPRILYYTGEPIGEEERKLFSFLSGLSEEKIGQMADCFVDGYLRGYEVYRIDFSGKKTVDLRYQVGMERVILAAIRRFRAMGVRPAIYRRAVSSLNKRQNLHVGYYSSGPDPQFEYDHRFDDSFYLDAAFVNRKLEVMEAAYREFEHFCPLHGGPILVEGFGAERTPLISKKNAASYTDRQKKLLSLLRSRQTALTERFLPSDTISFCIVSYPLPGIGKDFPEIFEETVRINSLDNDLYRNIHQHLIDALDEAEQVHVRGTGRNRTDIRVALWDCDPETESKFENCVADVNIPLGEVFTSPKLTGTEGVLHVSRIYLHGMEFRDLMLAFRDGMITDYSCGNFSDPEEGRAYISENILFNHETLPLGEFAIGTNTSAYRMARKYDIFDRLEILIAEKTGPHFAVGDTCYSHMEDQAVYNPDGKEIIARDNELVRRYKDTEPQKAYFSCHTDITIPYEELGSLEAVKKDGTVIPLIRNGRFVLPGTEELNVPLEDLPGGSDF